MQFSTVNRIRLPEDEPAFRQAWAWTQARPNWYYYTGGRMTWDEYRERAARPTQLDFAVWRGTELLSLVTSEAIEPRVFKFHLTSCPKVPAEIIAKAAYEVGQTLFEQMRAILLYTNIPHFHKGSQRLAAQCGFERQGERTDEHFQFHGKPVVWQFWAMDRQEYLVRHKRDG